MKRMDISSIILMEGEWDEEMRRDEREEEKRRREKRKKGGKEIEKREIF